MNMKMHIRFSSFLDEHNKCSSKHHTVYVRVRDRKKVTTFMSQLGLVFKDAQ